MWAPIKICSRLLILYNWVCSFCSENFVFGKKIILKKILSEAEAVTVKFAVFLESGEGMFMG